jgi:alkaline phosphatase D
VLNAGYWLTTSSDILEPETTPLGVIEFNYGIASGDPLATQVIIWTHAKYNNLDNDVYLKYEVSLDEIFSKIVKSEIVNTNKSIDFTLKVDVQELDPNTTYYYRFININDKINTSPIGRTRTIPDLKTEVDSINLATVSCSQYTRGYFNVYQDIGRLDNINAVMLYKKMGFAINISKTTIREFYSYIKS